MQAVLMAQAEPGPAPVALAEVKAYLRLTRDDEDGVIAGLVRSATALCEAFTGQWLLQRDGIERLAANGEWQRLAATPVVAVMAVAAGGVDLPAEAWTADVDASGDGWVRLAGPVAGPVTVRFTAGLGADWNGVPEPLRQGVIRLAVHLFSHRDAADAGPPPAAVAALWRPWRRLRVR